MLLVLPTYVPLCKIYLYSDAVSEKDVIARRNFKATSDKSKSSFLLDP